MAKKKTGKRKSVRRSGPREAAKSIRLTDARSQLTSLVDAAVWRGQKTVLTRNGKPVAMIVPIPGMVPGFEAALEAMAEGSDGSR